MTLTTFPETPYAWKLKQPPRLRKTQFGNGYSQESPDGLNHQLQEWELEFKKQPLKLIQRVREFLLARGGTEAFYFVSPLGETIKVQCTGGVGDITPDGNGLFSMATMTFKQIP